MRHIEANTDYRIQQVTEIVRCFTEQYQDSIREITEQFERGLQAHYQEHLSPMIERLELHAHVLSTLPSLTEQLGHIEETTQSQLRVVVEEVTHVKATLEQHTQRFPQLPERTGKREVRALPERHRTPAPNIRSLTRANRSVREEEANVSPNSIFDKGQFVRTCLTEHPSLRNSDIQRKAAEIGQSISPAYISETRKAFVEGQSTQVKGETVSEDDELLAEAVKALA